MNLLIVSDFHIQEKDIKEIESVFNEICIIKNNNKVDKLIIAGDTFDKVNPTPTELDCFSKFVKAINLPIILLAAQSHESISNSISVINHFGILKETISVVKEYIDGKHLFVGHFTLAESKYHYGSKVSKKSLEKYKYVVLGHQHSLQIIEPNICHIGAIRYIDFAESEDDNKTVLLITDYKTVNQSIKIIPLVSPIPMIDLELSQSSKKGGSQATTLFVQIAPEAKESGILGRFEDISKALTHLNQLSANTKVRVIFKDYGSYKEFLPYYENFKQKFVLFKDRKDFILSISDDATRSVKTETMKESLIKFLKVNNIDEEIIGVLEEEIK